MNYNWYFSENHNVNDQLIDEFVDSKFGIDKWTSFAREIIQNSLDAKDDHLGDDIPVKVTFELNKNLTIGDIPGASRIAEIMKLCINNITNQQTIKAYEAGVDLLNKKHIYCLKISDSNTIGVKSGRDEAWGALVYDTGKSCKPRPGSAGSYGVGKKVPFIISSINTVFYATRNSSDSLVEGKSILVDFFDEDDVRRSHIGWYGVENSTVDARNKVSPINGETDNKIHNFFKRTDSLGTDVIIIGVDIYNNEESVVETIIKAVLENFFIAIKQNKLMVEIKGFTNRSNILIKQDNFDDILGQYYDGNKSVHRETDTLIVGNLLNYISSLNSEPEIINVKDNSGNEIGKAKLYFILENDKNKKYYSMVRSHGMKICDYHISTELPFSAVVCIDGKDLNDKLSELENAAHDNFCTIDVYCSPENIDIFKRLRKAVENRIKELSKIIVGNEQKIEGLDNMLAMPGMTENITKKEAKQKIKKKKIVKPKPPKPPKPPVPPPPVPPGPVPPELPKPKPPKIRTRKKVVESFSISPKSIISNDSYHIRFATNRDILNGGFQISAIDYENKQDESITELIKTVKVDGNLKHYTNSGVSNLVFNKDSIVDIEISLKTTALYKLDINVFETIKELQ